MRSLSILRTKLVESLCLLNQCSQIQAEWMKIRTDPSPRKIYSQNLKSVSRHSHARPWSSSNSDTPKNKLSASLKPSQRKYIKPVTPQSHLEATSHVNLKPKLSLGKQLPQKRHSPDHIDDDDDDDDDFQ